MNYLYFEQSHFHPHCAVLQHFPLRSPSGNFWTLLVTFCHQTASCSQFKVYKKLLLEMYLLQPKVIKSNRTISACATHGGVRKHSWPLLTLTLILLLFSTTLGGPKILQSPAFFLLLLFTASVRS